MSERIYLGTALSKDSKYYKAVVKLAYKKVVTHSYESSSTTATNQLNNVSCYNEPAFIYSEGSNYDYICFVTGKTYHANAYMASSSVFLGGVFNDKYFCYAVGQSGSPNTIWIKRMDVDTGIFNSGLGVTVTSGGASLSRTSVNFVMNMSNPNEAILVYRNTTNIEVYKYDIPNNTVSLYFTIGNLTYWSAVDQYYVSSYFVNNTLFLNGTGLTINKFNTSGVLQGTVALDSALNANRGIIPRLSNSSVIAVARADRNDSTQNRLFFYDTNTLQLISSTPTLGGSYAVSSFFMPHPYDSSKFLCRITANSYQGYLSFYILDKATCEVVGRESLSADINTTSANVYLFDEFLLNKINYGSGTGNRYVINISKMIPDIIGYEEVI